MKNKIILSTVILFGLIFTSYLLNAQSFNPSETDLVTFLGEAAVDRFGQSVALCDLNGDGYDDIAIGGYQNDFAGTDAGRVYIYFGGETIDNTADIIIDGELPGIFFGNVVSSAGDVNSDGFDDLIVGAYRYDSPWYPWYGRAYIYFGGDPMDIIPDVLFTGHVRDDLLGNSVSTAGDVNNDGYDDVIIGNYCNDDVGYNVGRAFILYGGSNMDNVADVVLTGENIGDEFGVWVSNAGDVNNDGYDDVIVGAYKNDVGGSNSGSAYLFLGGENMNHIPDLLIDGESSNNYLGVRVAAVGDINNDGYDDFTVSTDIHTGKLYLFLGGEELSDIPYLTMSNGGYFTSTAGDINLDGYDDILVGCYSNDENGTDAGKSGS